MLQQAIQLSLKQMENISKVILKEPNRNYNNQNKNYLDGLNSRMEMIHNSLWTNQ